MKQKTKPGNRVWCVARDGSRMARCSNGIYMPIYIGGIYEARKRIRDGVLTWRRVESFGNTNTYVSDKWKRELENWTEYPELVVRHGEVCE